MKLKVFVLLALLTIVATAQESITWKEKYKEVNAMVTWGDVIYIKGERYLMTPSVIDSYENVTPGIYRDMLFFTTGGQRYFHWGNYTLGIYGTFECEWMLKGKRLYMKELRHMDAILDEVKIVERGHVAKQTSGMKTKEGTSASSKKTMLNKGTVPFSTDTLYTRMERATGCEFDKDTTMFMKNFNGTFLVKRANTAPHPENSWGDRVWDYPEYCEWWNEPIYKMTFKKGRLVKKVALSEIAEEYGDTVFGSNFHITQFTPAKYGKNEFILPNYLKEHIVYPTASKEAGHEGLVEIGYIVEKDGSIREAWVATSSGHTELDEAAKKAFLTLEGWLPARKYGRPVRHRKCFIVAFSIPEDPTKFAELPQGYRYNWGNAVEIRPE